MLTARPSFVRSRRPSAWPSIAAALALLLSLAAGGTSANAAQALRPAATRHIPDLVATAKPLGRKAATPKMTVAFVLPLRNQAQLTDELNRIANPKDPLFGKYMTAQQFADAYGPSPADVGAVAKFAAGKGLVVKDVSGNRTLIQVTGSSSAVESAFGVHLNSYQAMDGRVFFAPDREPLFPADVAGRIVGVTGLDNAKVYKPSSQKMPKHPTLGNLPAFAQPLGDKQPQDVIGTGPTIGGFSTLGPNDIRSIYNIPAVSSPGLGQTLAVFELDGYTPGDITAYDNYYYPSLAAVPLQNVLVDGYDGSIGDGTGEVTLDIEMMVALCPYATKIICYEAPNTTTGDEEEYSRIASDNLASIVSSSWGSTESGTAPDAEATSENQSFQQMARQGQSFFIASGDSGAYANQDSTTAGTLSVQDPGSQPYATSVGGTLMNDSSSEGYVSESAWSAPGDTNRGLSGTGSGGGISAWWPIPSYQSGFANASNLGSSTQRNVPDVSLFGDFDEGYYSIYLSADNGFSGSNGTSAAAPLWAAYVALVNQGRASHGTAKIGFINPAIYGLAKNTTTYNNDFHDINDGTTNLYYPAVTGYDLATGLGSPKGTALYNDLVAYGVAAAPTITSFTPTSGSVGTSVAITGTNFTGATSVKFHGTAATTFSVVSATSITATVPTGATTGTISVTTSGGTATSTASFTVTSAGASISGQVFFDHNGNGVQDSGDTGLSGWTVYVDSNGNGTFDAGEPSAVTDAGGNYTISGLAAGTYNVDLAGQSGYHESLPDVQYSGWSVTLTTGQTYTGLNYGETQTAALYGYVYNDANANGVFDSGEAALTGWTVFLDENGSGQPNGTNPTTTSSSTGYFEFTGLAAGGTYTMRIVLQSGYRITQPGSGGYYVSSNVASGFAGYGPFGVTTSGVTSAPTITSFSPTSGPVGTSVTITGTNFTGASSVKFNGTTATTFSVVSATSITATVPSGTTTGTVSVTTSAGTATSSASFTVTTTSGPPTITSFSPTSGPVGTSVVITGTNFTEATVVGFTGAHASFTVNSATQITTTVPTGAATGTIAVATPSGTAKSTVSFTVTTGTPAPTITSFTPTSGAVGTPVTITGTNFTGATSVKFHGTAATSYTVNSATQVTATVAGGTTTGTITVTTAGGTATSSGTFIVTTVATPTITSFSPTSGPVGTSVTITGTNFTGASSVKFNGTTATFTVNSATQVTATVATGTTTGTIAVTTSAGTATSSGTFTVTTTSGPPTITSFSPTSGPVGTSVVITGTNFTEATVVGFTGAHASFTVNSATQITTTVPTGAATGTIAVATPSGTAKSTASFTVTTGSGVTLAGFAASPTTVAPGGAFSLAAVLSGAAPAGGANVTLTLNGAAQSPIVVAAGQDTGTASYTAGSSTGTDTFVASYGGVSKTVVVTVAAAPTITNFTPASGPVGTVVVITGTNFASTTGVKFNGVAASGSITSNTQLTVTVPSGATTGRITVTTSAGTATSSASFTVTTSGVTITSFTPASGPVGTSVTIAGTGFTGATSVTFNGAAATFTVNSATSITAEVPAGATSGPVSVTAPSGSAMSGASYTVTF